MKNFSVTLLLVLLSMTANKALAYNIAVENGDNVTIYYNYINDGKELEVTTQNGSAGGGYKNVTKLSIPATVTYMSQTRLVTSIANFAFISCPSIESIKVEAGNTVYDSRDNCNAIIETATNSLRAGCKNTVIPIGVESIGKTAFVGCSGLTSIEIPNTLTKIEGTPFSGCEFQKVIVRDLSAWCRINFETSSCNPLCFSGHLYSDENTEVKALVIPDDVTYISPNAFRDASCLNSVTLLQEQKSCQRSVVSTLSA